ncbi:hypothetical protein JCR32_11075 [Bacillus sp. HNR-4]|uniref:hypothetical protein n=1 Tax=Bacillus sp. HNR-4 TaxID=2796141 RepID=UPI002378C59D|nr:hypothetical protein [Bacillus sp. HNR-4]WDL94308.1 hypothetical protein JCR32_11075 [Bacillus sp. HNR-4]
MNLQDYLVLQQKEFHEFGLNLDKTILVAADSLESLKKFYDSKEVKSITEYENDQCYLVEMEKGLHHLFIKGTYTKYREMFIKFLYDKYDVPKNTVPKSLNVDHVFNKARAKNYFIRMILLDEKSNQAWGRAYEKSMTRIDKNRGSVNKSLILLDYSVLLKILELPSFKKGNIKGNEDIKMIASEAKEELGRLFESNELSLDSIETFYRAELNQLKNGYWNDPFYIETVPFEIKLSKSSENKEFIDLINEIKRIFQSALDNKFFEYPGTEFTELKNHKYTITASRALNDGYIRKKEINEVCQNLLDYLDDAFEIEWEIKVRNKLIYFMIFRICKEGFYDEDTMKYEFNVE